MKITIEAQVYADGIRDNRPQEVTIGKSGNSVDFKFPFEGKSCNLRIDRSELSKVLQILDQGLM